MALIPSFFMNTVVALGGPTSDGSIKYNATGFLYGHPTTDTDESGQKLFQLFLVTNRHVFERALRDSDTLHARFNKLKETGANSYKVALKDASWTVHPSPDVDVAVMGVNANRLRDDEIGFNFFEADSHASTLEQVRAEGIGEGDGVFVLGFPMGNAGEERNYVIVRQGIMARTQDWLNGKSRTFLIDASVFPGNSGGPVVTKLEAMSIEGTPANNKCSLVGMVSGYLPYQEVAVSAQTGAVRMVFEENSGLARIVPVDMINETICTAIEKLKPQEPSSQVTEIPSP